MTFEQFKILTKTLEEFYNKDFNDTQMQIWFDDLKYYSPERYNKAIRYLCKTSQFKPTLNIMLETIQSVREREFKDKIDCNICNGTGYIVYKKDIDGVPYDYACLCVCKNSEGLEYDGTKLADKEHRSPFYIKKAEEIFGDKIKVGGVE